MDKLVCLFKDNPGAIVIIAAGIVVAILVTGQLTGTVGKRDSIMVCSVVACWSAQ